MTIEVGQRLPAATFFAVGNGVQPATTRAIFGGNKVVLFAVPGAFTPTCSELHLPGYIQHYPEFRQRGVGVACMAVNDAFVMQAWAEHLKVPDGLWMLADGNGDFTRALGLTMDASKFGMGTRSKRFALYAEDAVIKLLRVEAPGELRVSSAEAMLAELP